MKRMICGFVAVFGLFGFSAPAMAEYVSAEVLNCRAGPAASEAVLAKLQRGQSVEVQEASGTWSLLRSQRCWVLTRYLSQAYVSANTRSTTSSSFYGSTRSSGTKKPKASKRSSSSQSGCPCSGNKICIGPRGGRYCITSGGNKRYGV